METNAAVIAPSTYALEVRTASGFRHEYYSFLLVDGVPAAWFAHRVERGTPNDVIAQTVEVRDGYRGLGLARKVVEETLKHYGATEAYHSGGFTKEGYTLRHLFTRPENAGPAKIEYESMTFIHSWEDRTLHDNSFCRCWKELD